MEFGTVAPTFPPIEEARKTVNRLEGKGYSSLWFADHLMGWYPHELWKETPFAMKYPSCHMFFDPFCEICYAASSAEKMQFGVSVTEVFRRHPAVLLQQAVTANHATNGRFILGIGAGEAENIVPYGIEFEKPAARLEEALKLMKIMLESDYGEKINFEGRFFRLEDAVFDLKPVGKMPIWVGAHGDRMLKLTAEHADGWLPVSTTPKDYAERAEKLEKYAKNAGREPDEITRALFASIVIDEDPKEVEKLLKTPILRIHALLLHHEVYERMGLRHPLGKYYGLLDYIPTKFTRDDILEAVSRIPDEVARAAFICGTPEEIIQTFDEYRKLGVEHVVVWNLTYFGDVSKVKSSYALIDEVIEHFESKN
ncbi:LLM class flavin-dependent oxidoreductase [Geoglobus acetivorans]|uniref:LLM class flavin-dependent oxidoreductase n=1 Tax=Geoglobus acetivorans TaxID=565033 RepID=A0ABZ3H5N8_GEOAI|nr:LLM class flavin-dependent oxidoreductase [Geoglobus acetivorans]